MSRSDLFRRLRRAANAALAATPDAPRRRGPTRRQLLGGAAGAAALAIAGCGGGRGAAAGSGERIAVIGAGLAGLHCGFRLAEAGARVELFEAASRVGGRTHSARIARAGDQVIELGGELINSEHTTLRGLVGELGLVLDDLAAAVPADAAAELFHFDGRALAEAELVALFRPVAAKMARAIAAAEADRAARDRLDATSIADWVAGSGADPLLADILATAYTAEYGLEPDQQSVFNLLELIDYESPEPFRLLGDSDERYHVRGGNDQVARELARRLGDRVHTGMRLVALAAGSGGYTCTFEHGGSTVERTAERVVLALPFTLLRQVDLTRCELPEPKRRAIAELGYGTNAKLMSAYSERVWRTRHRASGSAVSDLGPQMTWDSSRAQPGNTGILTVFVGGAAGVAMASGSPSDRIAATLEPLDKLFPGMKASYLDGTAARMAWVDAPFARGSYACYKPGQNAWRGVEGQRVGNLHFCGEHTSVEAQGYMEGACESGLRVAREILGPAR